MVGEMRNGSGRWYVELIAQVHVPVRLYLTEVEAYAAARRVMEWAGSDWTQEPAYPTEVARAALRPGPPAPQS
jgi:hypothetical protein